MFAQVDSERNRNVLFEGIIDHQNDRSGVNNQDYFNRIKIGNKRQRKTTKGWEIIVQWKERRLNWIYLKEINNYYPVHIVGYEV